MKYETPQLTALTPAISAIQGPVSKEGPTSIDGLFLEEVHGYTDWEG